MDKLIAGIANLFLNKHMNSLIVTINILLYTTLLYEHHTSTVEKIYNILITDFSNDVKKKYNFNMEIIKIDQLKTLLNIIQLNEIFNKDYDYIELILQLYSSKRKNKELYNDLYDNYCTDINVIKYIAKQIQKQEYNYIINLFSGTGRLMEYIIKNNIIYKNMVGVDNDEYANIICKLNMRLHPSKHFDNIIKSDVLKTDFLIKGDIILCDIPTNIKNLIYANCCDKIKQLKIRGTKSEPLIIQLITTLLEFNGTAIVFVSNNFLHCRSKQHIETRKYLVNNLNVISITDVPELNKSILIFDNKTKTNTIHFSNIENNYNVDVLVSNLNDTFVLSSKYYHNDNLSEHSYINEQIIHNHVANRDVQINIPQTCSQLSQISISNNNSQQVKSIYEVNTPISHHISNDFPINNSQQVKSIHEHKYSDIFGIQKLIIGERKTDIDIGFICLDINNKILVNIHNILRYLNNIKDEYNTNIIDDLITYIFGESPEL